MQYTINQLREELFKPVFDVYAIFQNFFGEDRTDLQAMPTDDDMANTLMSWDVLETEHEGVYEISSLQRADIGNALASFTPFIVVWWPEVTVTNENNRSVVIYDLFAKIELNPNGTIPFENRGFQLNKTTYTSKQFASGYQHSHTPSVAYHVREIGGWQNPCLGTSPILATITTLKVGCDEMSWMLFCEEMNRCVTVESLKGGPYIKLETIGGTKEDYDFTNFIIGEHNMFNRVYSLEKFESFKPIAKDFTLFYLKTGHLSINYCSNHFVTGMHFYNYIIDISNSFIAFVNKYCTQEQCNSFVNDSVILNRTVRENRFMMPVNAPETEIQRYNNTRMLEFKGQQVNLKIIPDIQDDSTATLLNPHIAMFILQNILNIINYRFKNGHTTNTSESFAKANQTVIYV